MSWLLILIILLFGGGIILLGGRLPSKSKTRKAFLQELADFLEGKLEPIEQEHHENSFRIVFKFSGEEFIYEDFENQGFKDKVYKAFLKVKTPSKLTLTFTEKKHSTKIKTDIFLASEVSTDYVNEHVQFQVPKSWGALHAFTNDPADANELFEDKRIVSVFKQFKNVNTRGYPFLSIKIVEGEVILEFFSAKSVKPSLTALRADTASIEDYLEKLLVVVRRLKEKA